MKKFLLFVCLFSDSILGYSQSPDTTKAPEAPIKTVFNNPGKLGWWIAPEFAWTEFADRDGYLVGLSGGIIVKHSYSIGFAGYGIINSGYLRYNGIVDTADVYLYGGYGGLKLEYRLMPLEVINVAFPLLIGGGAAAYSTWGSDDWQSSNYDDHHEAYIWDTYFVIEPGIMLGINLLHFMRLDLGVSYRFTSNIYLPHTDNGIMSNLNLNSSLKFGKF
jgi:hypothetical protein